MALMILFCSEQEVCKIFFLLKELIVVSLSSPGTRQNAFPAGAASETEIRAGTTEKGV